jgi:hypothetical protein
MNTNLPTKEQSDQAAAFMLEKIHVPAFFEKLAAQGIQPRTDAERQQLLQMGAVLAEAEASGSVKNAADEGNPFLANILNKFAPAAPAQHTDAYVKHSADELVNANEVAKNAALIYAHAASGGELAPEQPTAT